MPRPTRRRVTPTGRRYWRCRGVHLHLYGKAEPRRARKMGHLTVTAPTAVAARDVALQAARCLGLPSF